ncbi:MAG: quinolinate synthase NadA [Candidatus Delongbacteria bacterium]|nr:quinolinate synthase NadA [Candidatus Delongbacteria bacterium]
MDKNELIEKINELKKKKNAVILVHSYQRQEVHAVADFIGDSLALAREAAKTDADMIVFCGVDFMAESAKILLPEKKVLLPSEDAKCPMAMMANAESLREMKKKYPEAVVITYINSSAEVKAESDIVCTSANALEIVEFYKDKKIIFTPDKHLGNYCKEVTGADIVLWDGYCYVHDEFSIGDIYIAKHEHPNCVLLVHPESPKDVLDIADFIGSTSQIMRFVDENAGKLDEDEGFIIGTEVEIGKALQKKYPEERIYNLAEHAVCTQMKRTTLEKVYESLMEEETEIFVEESIRIKALKALDAMLELSEKLGSK